MAYEIQGLTDTFKVTPSSTGKQYYVVKMSTTNDTVTLSTATGERVLGVLQLPGSSNAYLPVMLYGVTKIAHDGTLNPGDAVISSSDGFATEATTGVGVYRIGTCLQANSTVSGTIATIFLCPGLGQSTN